MYRVNAPHRSIGRTRPACSVAVCVCFAFIAALPAAMSSPKAIGQCDAADQILDKEVEYFPEGPLKEALPELSEMTGIQFKLEDEEDGELAVYRTPLIKENTLRKGLGKYLKRVGMTYRVEGETILIIPTERYARHKRAARRLKELGASLKRVELIPRLGVQTPVPYDWCSSVKIVGEWKGSDEDLQLLTELIELTSLTIKDVKLKSETFAVFGRLTDLIGLNLINVNLSDAEMGFLSKLEELVWLRLENMPIRGEGLKYLKKSPSLYSISLAYCPIESDKCEHLAIWNLNSLRMQGTGITDEGLRLLGGGRLEVLNLESTRITDAGIEHLARFESLTHLDLDKTFVTDRGLVRVAELCPRLEVLQCGWNDVSSEGVEALAKLKSLLSLSLEKTAIGEEGLMALVGIDSLMELYLHDNNFSHGANELGFPNRRKELQKSPVTISMKPCDVSIDERLVETSDLPELEIDGRIVERTIEWGGPIWGEPKVHGPPTDLELLQGKWIIESNHIKTEEGIKPWTPDENSRWIYVFHGIQVDHTGEFFTYPPDGGKPIIRRASLGQTKRMRFDSHAIPKRLMELDFRENRRQEVVRGAIYSLDGDKLTICYARNKEFPERLSLDDPNAYQLIVLERAKEDR